MHNYTKQTDYLLGRVGWRNSPPPYLDDFELNEANLKSDSGLYFDYVGGISTIRNIHSMYNEEIDDPGKLNEILLQLEKQAVNTLIHDIFSEQTEILGSYNLFPFEKMSPGVRTLEDGKFYGFRIEGYGLAFTVAFEKINLLFDTDVTFDLYLFNSNIPKKGTESKKVSVQAKAKQSTTIELNNWIADESEGGGVWYLGYFKEDIGVASPMDHEFGDHKFDSQYVFITREEIPVIEEVDDRILNLYDSGTDSYGNGLNPHITILQNYSGFILNNKSLFDKAIQLQMNIAVSEMILNSTRDDCNQNEVQMAFNQAWLKLHGDPEKRIYNTDPKLLNKEVGRIKGAIFGKPQFNLVTRT